MSTKCKQIDNKNEYREKMSMAFSGNSIKAIILFHHLLLNLLNGNHIPVLWGK